MKKFFIYFSLIVFLIMGSYGVYTMSTIPRTYDGTTTNVYEIYNNSNHDNYDVSNADGVANIMVKENLEKTHALNAVTAIVFDIRGFDTLGESFILLTAISGTMAILRSGKKGSADEDAEKHQG